MHHCTEVVFNELTVLDDTSSKASKRPRNENPTKSPKMPPSSATFKFDVRQLQLSPAIWCFTNQRGERVDQLLSFKPGNKYFFVIWVACHITDFLILPKKIKTGTPCLVRSSPQGEDELLCLHQCHLLFNREGVFPKQKISTFSSLALKVLGNAIAAKNVKSLQIFVK